jgi:hypothetical protein
MAKRKQQQSQMEVGPVKYTVERFLSSVEPATAKSLRKVWREGLQLAASRVPPHALPAVVLLATWARRNGIELVDDFDELLAATQTAFDDGTVIHHPDLFFVSCILILYARDQVPTLGGFESIGIPAIYNDLMGEE